MMSGSGIAEDLKCKRQLKGPNSRAAPSEDQAVEIDFEEELATRHLTAWRKT
jgi:hypothetical protein